MAQKISHYTVTHSFVFHFYDIELEFIEYIKIIK